MPTIREYSSQTQVAQGVGVSGGFDIGGVLDDVGAKLQQASARMKDTQQRQEVSDVQVKLAQARAEWLLELKKRAAEAPSGDPTFAETFNDDFAGYLAKVGQDYGTQAGQLAWKTGAAELSAQFYESAGSYQIESAGKKAKIDYLTALDLNRNVLQHEPSQYEAVLQSTLAALDDPSGMYAKMPADVREQLKRDTKADLGLSAFQGLAAQNPREALRQLSAGEWDDRLDADKMISANNLAERLIRAQELDLARAVAAEERAFRAQSKAAQDEYFAKLAAGTADPIAKAIQLDPRLTPEDKRSMLSVAERAARPDPASEISHVTASDLFNRIHSDGPDKITDENVLNQEFADGNLNRTDLDWLRKEVTSARTPEGDMLGKRMTDFFSAVEPQINQKGIMGVPTDPRGGEQMYRFEDMVRRKVQEKKKKGEDPFSLFDPASPDYLGKPDTIDSYTLSREETIQHIVGGAAAPDATLAAPVEYNSADDVTAAYRAGTLTREEATKILRDKGWAQ
jgi:hypothetical protein